MAPLGTANEPRNAAGALDQPVIGPAETLHHLSIARMQRCTSRDNAEFEAAGETPDSRLCLMSLRVIADDGRGDEG